MRPYYGEEQDFCLSPKYVVSALSPETADWTRAIGSFTAMRTAAQIPHEKSHNLPQFRGAGKRRSMVLRVGC